MERRGVIHHTLGRAQQAVPLQLGIDEAGRGCVIGPLVVAIVAATENDRRWFLKNRVRDSKIVPAAERDRLAPAIKERCWFQLKVSFPPDIDAAVRDRSRTLNGLELEHMSACLQDFMRTFSGREALAIVDAPSINAEGFRRKLHAASGWKNIDQLHAKHHADAHHRTVAAASIIAKHERERLIALLKQEIGYDFGCGYPHDARTIEHLKQVEANASHVRWSWKTTHGFPFSRE